MKYILLTLILFSSPLWAQEVKQLPVTCVTSEQAEQFINQSYNNVLLMGKSEVYQRPLAIVYNTQTNSYLVALFTGPNEVCFLDMGKGATAAFGVET